jgi:hypothetical protein
MKKVKLTLQEEILAIKRMNKKLLNENYDESYEMEEELSNIDMAKFEEEMPMDETDDFSEDMSMYEDDDVSDDSDDFSVSDEFAEGDGALG